MTPTPWLDTYAMRPSLSAPAIGDGLCCGALVEPLHAASTNAAISTSERARGNRAMSLGTLTRVTRRGFRSLLSRGQTARGLGGGVGPGRVRAASLHYSLHGGQAAAVAGGPDRAGGHEPDSGLRCGHHRHRP